MRSKLDVVAVNLVNWLQKYMVEVLFESTVVSFFTFRKCRFRRQFLFLAPIPVLFNRFILPRQTDFIGDLSFYRFLNLTRTIVFQFSRKKLEKAD